VLSLKELFKNKKQLAIISGAAVLLLVIAVVYLLTPHNKLPVSTPTSEPAVSDTEHSVLIETPDSTDESDTNGSTASEITDDGSALKPDESVSDSTDSQITGEKAQETVSPVQETEPPKDSDENDSGGIQIGGGETETKYSCGSPNHHCDGPETHAYILNLEQEGCPYCGSHSCPSFYAVDEWGNACYTPSKCPKYDITKDPVYYCQVCGRKNGNGDNNTCQKWIVDTVCPICGKLVKANECHTH
jgi:hypothetical protein